MKVETRGQAAAAGRKKYWTGKPCKRGHESPRYTSSGICCKCSSENSMAYQRRFAGQLKGHPKTVSVRVRVREEQVKALLDYTKILNGG